MLEDNVKFKNDLQKKKNEFENLKTQYEILIQESNNKQNKIDDLTENINKLKSENQKQMSSLIEKLKQSAD